MHALNRFAKFGLCLPVFILTLPPAFTASLDSVAPLNTARSSHAAALLPDGRLLAIGGESAGGATASCEIFDLKTGTWISTGSMTTPRCDHAAIPLPDGRVLAAGGATTGGTRVSSCEIYDPSTGSWSPTGSMASARDGHTAHALTDGRVLVTGGYDGTTSLTSCELYDPSSGTWSSTGSLNESRRWHCAAILSDGSVLAAGGTTGVAGGVIATCERYNAASGTWASTGSLATARDNFTLTRLPDGNVLAAGGAGAGAVSLTSCELYDPVGGAWSGTGSLSGARREHAASLLTNGTLLVTGGFDSGAPSRIATCELYVPGTGTWGAAPSMAGARMQHTATMLTSGRVLLVAGDNVGPLAPCELYDPEGGTWAGTGSMPNVRADFPAVPLKDGRILAAGGGTGLVALSACDVYDPDAGSWSPTAPLSTERVGHTATVLGNGKVLAVCGSTTTTKLDTCEIYDPAAGIWSPTATSSIAKSGHAATLLPDGRVLVSGGLDATAQGISTCERYDPSSGAWTPTSAMIGPRGQHAAVLLPTGKVLVCGGHDGTSFLATCELYDPAGGSWSATAPMSTARQFHTAVLLADGRVLVAGGENPGATANCEIYDPAAGTWSAAPSMAGPRSMHAAILLTGGRVLIAGGHDGASLDTCEIYNPALGDWTAGPSMAASRDSARIVPLSNGKILIAGGRTGAPAISTCELYEEVNAQPTWRPSITAVNGSASFPVPVAPGSTLAVSGSRFRGISEASAGATHGSLADFPIVQLVSFPRSDSIKSGEGANRHWTLPATGWAAGTSLSVVLPTAAQTPTGFYFLTIIVNGIPSASKVILIDATPPIAGTVRDGAGADIDVQASTTMIAANWSGFSDPESGIAGYAWAIGTTPGGTDVQAFTNVGGATSASNATLALVSGTTYYVTVRATNGAGLQSAATSDGVLVDATPPIAGTVRDGTGADIDVQTSTTTIAANWSGFSDPESGIAGYAWAIGTTPGGTDIQAFTGVGAATSASNAGLALTSGTTYYVTVRAINGTGLTVEAVSNGVLVDAVPPMAPTLLRPGDGAQLIGGIVSFAWSNESASGAVAYRIQVGVAPSFASPVIDAGGLTATAYTNASPLPVGSYVWRVIASDAAGNTAASAVSAFSILTYPPDPPTGLSAVVSGSSVAFAGTVSDPDGDTVRLEVEVGLAGAGFSGMPTVAGGYVVSGSAGTAVLAGLANGNYDWRARAVDARGAASAWVDIPGSPDFTISVAVNNPPAPPASGALAQLMSDGVTLLAVGATTNETMVKCRVTVSDPDGNLVRAQIEFRPAGEPFTGVPTAGSALADSGSDVLVTVPNLQNGAYHWRARLADASGATSAWTSFGDNLDGAADVTVNLILNPPAPPANLTATPSATSGSVSFTGLLTDPGDTVKLQIEVKPAGNVYTGIPDTESPFVPSGSTAAVGLIGLANGTYQWRARAVDSLGNVSAWVDGPGFAINVNTAPANPAGLGVFSTDGAPASPVTRETVVVFQATVTDPDGDPVQIEVVIQPGGITRAGGFVDPGAVASVTVTLDPGAYTWQARARDARGLASADVAGPMFQIDTTPPVIGTIVANPASGVAPLRVSFGASLTSGDAIAAYAWDFDGDGAYDLTSPSTPSAIYTYAVPGTYSARLRVTDVAGNAATAAVTVTVVAPPPPPATLSADVYGGPAPLTVHFTATVPRAAEAIGYLWDFDGDGNIDAKTLSPEASYVYLAAGAFPASLRILYNDATSDRLTVSPPITVSPPDGGLSIVRIVRVFVDANNNGQRDGGEKILANCGAGLEGKTIVAQAGQRIGFEGAVDLPPGVGIAAWEWDFTGTGSVQYASAVSNTATYVYESDGRCAVTLTLTDTIAATGDPRSKISTTLTMDIAPPTDKNRRVFFTGDIKGGSTISGNCFVFNVNAVPASAFDFDSVQVQFSATGADPWASVPVSARASAPPSARLTVDLTALIPGALTAGTTYQWRCQATGKGGLVVNSTDAGQQGPIPLTPVAGGGDIHTDCHSPPVNVTTLDPFKENSVALAGKTRIVIPHGGVPMPPTQAESMRVVMRSLAEDPAVGASAVAGGSAIGIAFIGEYRELMVADGRGITYDLQKPARVRIYYPDVDGDGIVDGTSVPETSLRIFRFVDTRWVELEDTVLNPGEKWIEGTTPGFSYFALAAEAVPAGGGGGGGGGTCFAASASSGETVWVLSVLLLVILVFRLSSRDR